MSVRRLSPGIVGIRAEEHSHLRRGLGPFLPAHVPSHPLAFVSDFSLSVCVKPGASLLHFFTSAWTCRLPRSLQLFKKKRLRAGGVKG